MAEAQITEIDVILVLYVHNRPGVLAKIASLFYRRGLNIRTLTVGTTHEVELSKIVVRVAGPEAELRRLVPALGNLVDVLSVELADAAAVRAQELCLVRVAAADRAQRDALLAAAGPFQPTLVDAGGDSIVLEVAGAPAAIELFIETIGRFPIVDMSRTGVTTMPGRRAPRMSDALPQSDGVRFGSG